MQFSSVDILRIQAAPIGSGDWRCLETESTLTITIEASSVVVAVDTFHRLVLGDRRTNIRGTELMAKSSLIFVLVFLLKCSALMATPLIPGLPILRLLYPARYPETTEMTYCKTLKPAHQLCSIGRRRFLYLRLMRRPRSLPPTCKGAATQRGITLVRFPRQLISTAPVCQVPRLRPRSFTSFCTISSCNILVSFSV